MRGDGLLESIRIENVRSLKDTGTVSLPPVTLLVGQNSSGKSTFLRTFPLIKQSISKRTDGPLLWAGDVDDYVDFGSFSEALTNDGAESMSFHFGFSYLRRALSRQMIRGSLASARGALSLLDKHLRGPYAVVYSITVARASGRECISQFELALNGTSFWIDLLSKKTPCFLVDGVRLDLDSGRRTDFDVIYADRGPHSRSFGFRLPGVEELQDALILRFLGDGQESVSPGDVDEDFWFSSEPMDMRSAFYGLGGLLCMGRTLPEIRALLAECIEEGRSRDIRLGILERMDNIAAYLQARVGEAEGISLTAALKLCFFYSCFPDLDDYLNAYFRQVHYIAPLRATAERYYRLRNLAIDEVDYQGKNLAVFLNGLSKARLRRFQQWTLKQFGFQVEPKSAGGHHLSVNISLQGGVQSVNLSDTGFGYSQILPIITQLWDLSTREEKAGGNVPLVIAIEQPELHLHPALQARLASAFIACIRLARDNGYRLQLLLETHSQTIVNYFGRAIAKGRLGQQDVSVVLFDKSPSSNLTDIRTSHYDEYGYLQDWPMGFFDAEE